MGKDLIRRMCSAAAALTATAMLFGAACVADTARAADEWREGGGLAYPLDRDLAEIVDDGAATYVGGNLNIMDDRTDPDHSGTLVVPSRAAEAEGLTVVDGWVQLGSQHDGGWDWNNRSFRFGAAGLGSGHGPARGDVVLAVGSAACGNSIWNYYQSTAFVAASRSDDAEYRAKLAVGPGGSCGAGRTEDVLAANADGTRADWIEQTDDPLADVNGVDYRAHRQSIQQRSAQLAAMKDTGAVAYGVAPADADYWRTNWQAENVSYKFIFEGEDGEHRFAERLVTFTGDGKSAVQVFTMDAAQLVMEGWHGVSWRFDAIPEDAAVVVNVRGAAQDVVFDNGWRFWWNGVEIGNAWGKDAPADTVAAFREAASSIMWNFKDASSVRIQGGRLNNGDGRDTILTPGSGSARDRWGDPAAEFIGSILVPDGALTTEASTNGRVMTGGDYTMASGTIRNDGSTSNPSWNTRASVLGMEQERHNFPWIGLMHLDGREVSWRKSDTEGNLLPGSRWQVYATLADAKARTNALLSVTDNDALDLDGQDGVIAVGNLKGGHDYFIRETAAPSGYDINEGIWAADADTGALSGVDGAADAALGADNAIVNQRSTQVSWVKYDASRPAGDTEGVLAGSQWTVTPDGAEQGTPVADATVSAESVEVTRQGGRVTALTLFQGESAQLYAEVAPADAPRTVRWTSADPAVASVDGGLVTAGKPGTTTIDVASGADPAVKATLEVRVTGDFTLVNAGTAYEPGGAYAVVAGEHPLTLSVDSDRLPHVTSSDTNVARVRDGKLIAGNPGTARLSYTVAGQAREFTLTVVPEGVTAVFFATRHGDNIYKTTPDGPTGEIICHDERKPVCTPELTDVRYEDNILKAQKTANDADWSVVYVPNENLDAFDYVVGANVGRYSWTTNGAPMQSVEIKAMRGPDYSNFHAPAGQIAVWMENWDSSGTGVPGQMKPSRTGDVRITDDKGDHIESGGIQAMDTGSTLKLTARVVQGTGDTDGRVYWKSSNTDVAAVSDEGAIEARSPGIADVYAIALTGSSQWVQVHVVDPGDIALYMYTSQLDGLCGEDDPCAIRESDIRYRQWTYYDNDRMLIGADQWDSRDKTVISHAYDTAHADGASSTPITRLDIPRDAIPGKYVYLTSRKTQTVQCSVLQDASLRARCTDETGGSFVSEWGMGPYGFTSTFGRHRFVHLDYVDVSSARILQLGGEVAFVPSVAFRPGDAMPGLTDEEKASIETPDDGMTDTLQTQPKQVNPAWEDMDTRAGHFHIAAVQDGTYRLEETAAPTGYARLEAPLRFEVRDGQVFWPEGLPVIESTAWIANTRAGTPPDIPADSPDTSGESGPSGATGTPSGKDDPKEPGGRPQVSADDISGITSLAATGMEVSVAGVVAVLSAALAIAVLSVRERLRPHGRHAGEPRA